jgi:titin
MTTATATPGGGSPTATQLPTNTPSLTATPIPATPTAVATVAAAPAAPSGLTASGLTTGSSTRQINLAWSDNSANEDGFKIERSTDGTAFSQIATVGVSTKAYVDTSGLSAHQWYYYRVRAHNSAGDSAYSNTARARMQK